MNARCAARRLLGVRLDGAPLVARHHEWRVFTGEEFYCVFCLERVSTSEARQFRPVDDA